MRTIANKPHSTQPFPGPSVLAPYHPPTLSQALDFEVNESKRGVRLVRLGDLPDHRLRELTEAARQLEARYGSSTFRWQGEAAALVLKHRKTEVVPL